ncbi:MAG: imidazolonepropionase [Mizugakiibacter sp.]|uniref:imidazolonepropionase n=1 Tax=Mizugakiibacter sp. TaxID=1972610 RepID=UPI0031C13832|nr:imidazolonepropionase [Xanthomonadaceae bacterium]
MNRPWDHLLLDANLATLTDTGAPYGAIERAAIAWKDGALAFVGRMDALPGKPDELAAQVESANGAWITPGLIDCHTHLVFGGQRAGEFEMRLEGASYEQIARAGGGIVSSVRATRAAGEDALLAQALPRARALVADGVTTLEIKSGYGLEPETERRMLRVARRLGAELGIGVRTSFLGLHALPPEFADDRAAYVALVCDTMLPALAEEELADAVDAFCEGIGFTPEETRRVFARARALGLPVKLHADQLSDLGGAALAAEFAALSADHLEWTSEASVRAMARAGTVAVLLPGAYYALRETRLPPVAALRAHGVPIAVATDLNPGTSPLLSLRLAMSMACTLFRLTPEEALRGATAHAARALGLADRGTLAVGRRADLVVWDIGQPAELCYWIGGGLARRVIVAGADLHAEPSR